MDPNTTLKELINAAVEGDALTLMQRADSLATWLDRGGFPPDNPRQPKNSLYRECTCRYCMRGEHS